MKYRHLFLTLFVVFPTTVNAESNFSFSPPPITQVVKEGETKSRVSGYYMNIDQTGNSISAFGVNFVQREALNKSSAFSFGLGGMVLGDEASTMTGFFMSGNGNFELYINDDPSAIAFVGVPVSFGFISIDSGGSTTDIATFTTGVQAGLQKQIWVGNNTTVVPYVMFSAIFGSSSISTAGGTFSDTFDYTTTTFGLDIIIGDISIGSMINTGADDDILIIQVGFGF